MRAWLERRARAGAAPRRGAAARDPFAVARARLADRFPEEVAASERELARAAARRDRRRRRRRQLPGADPERDAEAIHHLAMGWHAARGSASRAQPQRADAEHLIRFAVRGAAARDVRLSGARDPAHRDRRPGRPARRAGARAGGDARRPPRDALRRLRRHDARREHRRDARRRRRAALSRRRSCRAPGRRSRCTTGYWDRSRREAARRTRWSLVNAPIVRGAELAASALRVSSTCPRREIAAELGNALGGVDGHGRRRTSRARRRCVGLDASLLERRCARVDPVVPVAAHRSANERRASRAGYEAAPSGSTRTGRGDDGGGARGMTTIMSRGTVTSTPSAARAASSASPPARRRCCDVASRVNHARLPLPGALAGLHRLRARACSSAPTSASRSSVRDAGRHEAEPTRSRPTRSEPEMSDASSCGRP